MSENKCVFIIDSNLPNGIMANTAAVLALSIGKLCPEIVGRDLFDSKGSLRRGITTMALPTLKGNRDILNQLRSDLLPYEPQLIVVDLISATRTTRSYDDYAEVMAETDETQYEYQGIAIYGHKKLVNKFTGNLPLLR